jgi:hypothetical protein
VDTATRRKKSFGGSVVILIGHLTGTTVIFAAVFVLGWLLSFGLAKLDDIHHFPEEILRIGTQIELYLFLADAVLSGIMALLVMVQFLKDLWRDGL